ncbi:DUF4429 domain-containing protein [Arthrobacter sp. B0490]|uniref:DUF4429 domain-containing protein n=1 Tax=Arthrobacter sp. B0490 TaxID=2058891 RepID=UPI0015E3BFA7|nr:DUF4429 domain-containing protein [Arthrobacter sp. B0490]
MDDKQAARAEEVRRQTGIPAWVSVWVGRQGWAAYANGILTVKMSLTPQVVIPIQDITKIDFKPSGGLTNGHIRFNRATDKFGDRQDIIFSAQDEAIFAELKRTIEQEQWRGVQGQRPESPRATANNPVNPAGQDPDDKFRAKYNIPAEALLARAKGVGYVAFDGHFVTIQQIGLGRLTIGKGVKRIPITAISSVQIKPPGVVMSGFIQFSIAGGNEKTSRFGHQTMSAVEDENSVVFVKGEEKAFLAMRNAIESAQRALHQPAIAHQATPVDDVFAQLEKLGKLRDEGIVSDGEFEARKTELLSRM